MTDPLTSGPQDVATGSSVPARLRIVAWILLATALSFLAVVVTVRSALVADVEQAANADVAQEVDEFRTFAAQGLDPQTGQGFSSAERLVRLHLQRQFPGESELLVGLDRSLTGPSALIVQDVGKESPLLEQSDLLFALFDAEATSGVADTPTGPVRWGRADARVGPGDRGASFLIVEDNRSREAGVDRVTRLMALVCLGGLLGTAGLAWLVAGQILGPVRLVRRAAARITRADLSERIAVRGRDDVAALALTFNAMLDRLQQAFTAQQRFTELAGQHLREPLHELQADGPARTDRSEHALARMTAILDDLDVLAQAERPDFVQPRAVDLGELLADLADDVATVTGREVDVVARADGAALLDPGRVGEAVRRIALNAARYAPDGDPLRLGAARDDHAVRLWITDGGPGLSEQQAERVFERFATADDDGSSGPGDAPDDDRDAGPGLGLAVVRAVADAHQGSAYVESVPGEGATFGLELPVDPPSRTDALAPVPAQAAS